MLSEEPTGGVLQRKLFLKILQYSQGNTFVRIPFLKRDFKTGVSCEYCEIFRKTYFQKQLRTTVSVFFSFLLTHISTMPSFYPPCFQKGHKWKITLKVPLWFELPWNFYCFPSPPSSKPFLSGEAIVFIHLLILFIHAISRSSMLKWHYFRDLIILFLEYNHNERTINL